MGDELQELRRDFHKIYYEQVAAILLQCEDLRKEQLWSTLLVADEITSILMLVDYLKLDEHTKI